MALYQSASCARRTSADRLEDQASSRIASRFVEARLA